MKGKKKGRKSGMERQFDTKKINGAPPPRLRTGTEERRGKIEYSLL